MKKYLALFLMVFVLASCEKGEKTPQQGQFVLHTDGTMNMNQRFILVTSPIDGQVLFSKTDEIIENEITFEDKGHETVDITYGFANGPGFQMYTFRDIMSGFRLSIYVENCLSPHPSGMPPLNSSLDSKLVIKGTKEITEIINNPPHGQLIDLSDTIPPDLFQPIIKYDYDNEITTIESSIGHQDFANQYTFRFSGEDGYKSLVVTYTDWVKNKDGDYQYVVNYDDMKVAKKHTIELGAKADNWSVDGVVTQPNQENICISSAFDPHNVSSSNTIDLYLQEGIEMNELWLSIKGGNNKYRDGYTVKTKKSSIPKFIAVKTSEDYFTESMPQNYTISTSNNFDLLTVTYRYITNNWLSYWEIYQTPSSDLSYNLPNIISDYLDSYPLLKNSLPVPKEIHIESFDIEDDTDVNSLYQKTNIEKQLHCVNFNSRYREFEF